MSRLPENIIEARLVGKVEGLGGEAYKFTSPGRRGVADRLVLLPIRDPEHQAIVATYLRFVECKAPGKTLRQIQAVQQRRLQELGYATDVVASTAAVDRLAGELHGPA
jgi:hypothetical protein